MNNKLELTWVGKNDNRNIEPRIFILNESRCYGDKNTKNVLIHGDNLLALRALEADYTGKIKCVYIDPPYNTGSAFENYDDGIEHSLWLSLMSDRLKIIKKLLSDDGIIFVQIDDNEQAYLKVLMDEIFGRSNFVNCIAIKMSPSSGVKRRFQNIKFIKNKEFILVYKKNNISIKPIYDEMKNYDVNYTIYFDGYQFCNLNEKLAEINSLYSNINTNQYLLFPDIKKFILNNKDNIYRRHGHSKWVNGNINDENLIFTKCEDYIPRSRIWKVFNPSNSEEFELIMNTKSGYERLEPLSWKIMNNKLTILRGDFWDGYESDMGNVSKEGVIETAAFGEGQKPERLLKDIIESVTEEGDIVLDSFLGSGTTCAVAQKLNRNWIGIELGSQCYTHCIPRLNNIINGKDNTGISKNVDLSNMRDKGYKFYELAPTLIKKDAFEQEIVNPKYDEEMLKKAIALHEDFIYKPSNDFFWKQSIGNENSYLYVTTNFVGEATLDNIKREMKENEYLIIACTSFDKNIENKYKNIKIKKIPENLMKNYEYDKDNYNLNIVETEEVLLDE